MKASHLVIIFLTLWFLCVSAAAWAAYSVFVRPGMIEVSVTEEDWDQKKRMKIFVPAGLANGAIRMTGLLDDLARVRVMVDDSPFDVEWHGDRELAELMKVLAEELEAEEDLRILEVRDGEDHVVVDLRQGALYINAESWTESVEIVIPQSTLRAAADVAQDLAY